MLQNKIRYILIIVITGWLAILYNEYFMGILFLTVVALPILLFAILSYLSYKLTLKLNSDIHVANKNDLVPVSFQIHNPTIFPVSNLCITISYHNSFSGQGKSYKKDFYVSVDKASKSKVTCYLVSNHAGNLNISLSKIRIFDYLKLFSLRKRDLGFTKVAILPLYYELTEDYLEHGSKMQIESDNYSKARSGDDPSEVFAIREYREGDRPQRIHWKLSMKQNQLMIKDFSEPMNCSVVILLDLEIPRDKEVLNAMDSLLESALSLSYSFMLRGHTHYLTWYDEKIGTCRKVRIVDEKDLFEAVDGLLNSGPYMEDRDMIASYFAEYPNDQYTDLIYVTKIISDRRLASLLLIKAIDRQILYINGEDYADYHKSEDAQWDLPIDYELIRKTTEAGIGVVSINSSKIKTDLEELRLR